MTTNPTLTQDFFHLPPIQFIDRFFKDLIQFNFQPDLRLQSF